METMTMYSSLTNRVYNTIGEEQLKNLLLEGQSLWPVDEIAECIKNNLTDYLSPLEQQQLIQETFGFSGNSEINSLALSLCIELVAADVHQALRKAVTSKEFIGDNPFSPLAEAKMFMLYKFYNEHLGVKLNFIE